MNFFAQDTWEQMGVAVTGLVTFLTLLILAGTPLVILAIKKYFEIRALILEQQKTLNTNFQVIEAHKDTLRNLAIASPENTQTLLAPLVKLDGKLGEKE